MTTWWSREDAWPTLLVAAQQRGISVEILEKDYWVTQALRCLAARFPNDFVFKGGTSLSKAFDCIQRFSEDVDLLVLPGTRGRNATSTLMKEMVAAVAEAIGGTTDSTRRSHETGRHLNEYVSYAARSERAVLEPTVLLEIGVRGADQPHHMTLPIAPMVASDLVASGFSVHDHPDLWPFDVPVLHPGRTLIEKIMMLHFKVTTGVWESGDRFNEPTRVGRHYHDVQRLLERDDVRGWLGDRNAFLAAVDSHEQVNRKWFGNDVPPRPSDGYAASMAFHPGFAGHLELSRFYDLAMRDLYLGPGPSPAWSEVVAQVQGAADLL